MQVEVLEKQEELEKKNLSYEERIEELEKKTLYKNKAVTDDYNDYTEEGSYMINAQNMKNSPNRYVTGSLLVLKTGAYLSHFIIGAVNNVACAYVRFRNQNLTWTSWKEL